MSPHPLCRIALLLACCMALTPVAFGQNCATIQNLPDTIATCPYTTVVLNPNLLTTGTTVTLDTTWTPATGLSDPNIINPVVTMGATSQTYTLDITALAPINSVANGNFSNGNTDFTSAYTVPSMPYGTWGQLSGEATYAITTSPNLVHSNFAVFPDHTGDAAGMMMVVNGASSVNTSIWCQTIAVTPNTDYDFSAWGASCVASNTAILQFEINGLLVGTPLALPNVNGTWVQFHAIWNSGSNTSITICINDQQTAPSGNDFAIDDIEFRQICHSTDSVHILVPDLQTAISTTTLLGCEADTVLFSAVNSGATTPDSFLWNFGGGLLDTSSAASPLHVYQNQGTYNITLFTSRYGCLDTATATVALNHSVAAAFAQSADTICKGQAISFTNGSVIVGPGAGSYAWAFGDGGTDAGTSPSHPYPTPGIYDVTMMATDAIGCADTAFGKVVVEDYGDAAIAASDSLLCIDGGVRFDAVVGTDWNALQWDLGDGTVVADQLWVLHSYGAPGTYTTTLTLGYERCPSQVLTRQVTVEPPPYVNAGPDFTITAGESVRLLGDAPAAQQVQWMPGGTLSDPTIIKPKAAPMETTTYTLTVIDTVGCGNSDEMTVTVLYNDPAIVPTAFTPNGDGLNDVFRIALPGIKKVLEFRVYNRWGREVYSGADINEGWDGRYNGEPAELGVYHYLIRLAWPDGRAEMVKGDVTLVR